VICYAMGVLSLTVLRMMPYMALLQMCGGNLSGCCSLFPCKYGIFSEYSICRISLWYVHVRLSYYLPWNGGCAGYKVFSVVWFLVSVLIGHEHVLWTEHGRNCLSVQCSFYYYLSMPTDTHHFLHICFAGRYCFMLTVCQCCVWWWTLYVDRIFWIT
jgi:hypothetical protein